MPAQSIWRNPIDPAQCHPNLICLQHYWLPVDYSTDPQFDSRWYTFGFTPNVVTNCKILPGQKQPAEVLQPKVA